MSLGWKGIASQREHIWNSMLVLSVKQIYFRSGDPFSRKFLLINLRGDFFSGDRWWQSTEKRPGSVYKSCFAVDLCAILILFGWSGWFYKIMFCRKKEQLHLVKNQMECGGRNPKTSLWGHGKNTQGPVASTFPWPAQVPYLDFKIDRSASGTCNMRNHD